MKKALSLLFSFTFLLTTAFLLTACGTEDTEPINTTPTVSIQLSDYTLPENFAITIQVADTAISNPGNPWYYKTAKIGNNWQVIEYDREISDITQQATHFFMYASENNYTQYDFNYNDGVWQQQGTVTFAQMVAVSCANFSFLYDSEHESQLNVVQSNVTYDTDPTSAESLLNAIKYEYTYVNDVEEIVDAQYTNILLSQTIRDGSTILISNRAYEYTKSIDTWDSSYMTNRFYQLAPVL